MSNRPRSRIHFTVEWKEGMIENCTSVSGLEIDHELLTYRTGASKEYGDLKSPGRPRYPNLRIQRYITPGGDGFYEWMNTIRLDTVERRNLTISLLDGEHEPFVVWKVKNAFPVRLIGPKLDANGTEPATETLELCHEGLAVETA